MTHCCEPSASAVLRATSSRTSSRTTVDVMLVLASRSEASWRVRSSCAAVGARVVDGRTRQLAQPGRQLALGLGEDALPVEGVDAQDAEPPVVEAQRHAQNALLAPRLHAAAAIVGQVGVGHQLEDDAVAHEDPALSGVVVERVRGPKAVVGPDRLLTLAQHAVDECLRFGVVFVDGRLRGVERLGRLASDAVEHVVDDLVLREGPAGAHERRQKAPLVRLETLRMRLMERDCRRDGERRRDLPLAFGEPPPGAPLDEIHEPDDLVAEHQWSREARARRPALQVAAVEGVEAGVVDVRFGHLPVDQARATGRPVARVRGLVGPIVGTHRRLGYPACRRREVIARRRRTRRGGTPTRPAPRRGVARPGAESRRRHPAMPRQQSPRRARAKRSLATGVDSRPDIVAPIVGGPDRVLDRSRDEPRRAPPTSRAVAGPGAGSPARARLAASSGPASPAP